MIGLVLVAGLAVFLGSSLPGGFLPTEDQGYMFLALQLPDGASAQRTDAAEQKITDALLKTPGIEGVIAVTNFSLLTQVQSTNAGFFFVNLKPWEARKTKERAARSTCRPAFRSSLPAIPMELRLRFRRPRFPASEPRAA